MHFNNDGGTLACCERRQSAMDRGSCMLHTRTKDNELETKEHDITRKEFLTCLARSIEISPAAFSASSADASFLLSINSEDTYIETHRTRVSE